MLMYSALNIMQWFSGCLDVFTRKSNENFRFYELKLNVAYTRLEVIAGTKKCTMSYRLVQCQTDLLLCIINCFLR